MIISLVPRVAKPAVFRRTARTALRRLAGSRAPAAALASTAAGCPHDGDETVRPATPGPFFKSPSLLSHARTLAGTHPPTFRSRRRFSMDSIILLRPPLILDVFQLGVERGDVSRLNILWTLLILKVGPAIIGGLRALGASLFGGLDRASLQPPLWWEKT